MDFDLSPGQRNQLSALDEVIEACGGLDRARQVARDGGHDADLDAKLASSGLLNPASLLDRLLVAERLAQLGVASTFGLRALLSADGVTGLPDGPLAVLDPARSGPVRYGGVASSVLVLEDNGVRAVDAADVQPKPVPSSFGFDYAHVTVAPGSGTRLDVPADVLRRRWRLSLAAEVAGTAAAGITHTCAHLRERQQFGRALSTFQALRHRIAEAAVSAEATRWMTREAAWSGDERAVRLAAWYAASTAAALAPELTQLCGARGFTLDFGLHVCTMRLEGLRLELGALDRIAVELAACRDH